MLNRTRSALARFIAAAVLYLSLCAGLSACAPASMPEREPGVDDGTSGSPAWRLDTPPAESRTDSLVQSRDL